jgi:hypothetical protein
MGVLALDLTLGKSGIASFLVDVGRNSPMGC